MFFFDNTKKASIRHPPSSKAISNHPLQNDEPRGDPDNRYHTVSTHAQIALRETDNVYSQFLQLTRQTSMVFTKEKEELQNRLLKMQDVVNTTLNTSEARGKEIEQLKEEVQKLHSVVTSSDSAEKLAKSKIHELETKVLQRDENILKMQDVLNTTLNTNEARGKEIEQLKEEVQKLESDVTSSVSAEKLAESKIHELETKVLQQDENILKMQDVVNTTLNTSEVRGKEIERLKEEVQRLDSIMTSSVSAEKLAGSKNRELERKVLQRDENIRNLEQKLRISEEQRSQTTKILDERTAELKGAQGSLTIADRYSEAGIIKMAESLNAEIFQASAMMAELLVDAPVVEDSVQRREYMQRYKKYLEHGQKQIGSQLFDHLKTMSREIRVDPLPLQLTFQALFTSWCVYEVDKFCDGPAGESLKQIYKRIYKSETQAVAGRWRALTSAQTMNSDTPSNASHVYHIILSLMLICGGFASEDAKQRAKLSVQQAVLRVEKIWKKLKTAIMQEITTAEITMISVGPESDYNAAKMDDMYIDANSDEIPKNPDNHGQHILCSVGVGLQRDVLKQCQDGTMQINGEVILKPKITLPSVLLKVTVEPSSGKFNNFLAGLISLI